MKLEVMVCQSVASRIKLLFTPKTKNLAFLRGFFAGG